MKKELAPGRYVWLNHRYWKHTEIRVFKAGGSFWWAFGSESLCYQGNPGNPEDRFLRIDEDDKHSDIERLTESAK